MDDLISRQALLKQIDIDSDGEPGYYGDTWKFIDTIKNMPPALGTNLAEVGTECISRQQAIDGLRDYLVGKRCPDDGTLTCRLIENEVINKLPTIHHEHGTNLAEVGTDCISRQAAVDMLMERASTLRGIPGDLGGACSGSAKLIMQMPPAEPQIIRCKDCRYYDHEGLQCLDIYGYGRRWEENDWCSYAERREVTT